MNDSEKNIITCKSCNVHTVSRICDLMRHIKKCDPSVSTPIEYKIKYEYNGKLPICHICNKIPAEIMKTKISEYCRPCRIHKMSQMVKVSAIRRFKDPAIKSAIMDKRKATTLEKYGVEHISQLDEIKNKKKTTVFNNYGVSALEVPTVKEARIEALENNKELINKKRKDAWTEDLIKKTRLSRINTCIKKYGVIHTSKLQTIKDKISDASLERYKDPKFKQKMKDIIFELYQVNNVSQLSDVKNKIIKTSLEKYNSRHYLSSDLRKELMIESKKWLPDHLISPFLLYKRECKKETNKYRKSLFSSWDGNCYYTNEKLLNDKREYNHPLYRTIDHKIPIYVGFIMNIPYTEIGNINNLCICGRGFNSSKNIKVL